jgi:hypothetical protein
MTYALCVLAGLLIGGLAAWLIASASWRETPTRDTARFKWNKVAHYYLSVDAMKKPTQIREGEAPYGRRE